MPPRRAPGVLLRRCRDKPSNRRRGVELAQHGGGDLFDDLRLFGGEILAPAAGRGLAVELALAFHVLGDRFPRVPLHGPLQLPYVHLYSEGRVQAPHASQGVGAELFVEYRRLVALVGVECPAGVLHVAQVLLGRPARHGLRALVGEAPASRAAAPLLPAVLLGRVQRGRHDVSRVADQEYHPALGQRLHQERRPHAAAGFLDHQIVLRLERGEGMPGAGQNEVPYRGDPTVAGRGAHDEVRRPRLLLRGVDVELPEEVADPRLPPDLVAAQIPHHLGQPRAPATGDAEDPDDVGGDDAPFLDVRPPGWPRPAQLDGPGRPHRRGGQPAPQSGQPRVPGGGPPPEPSRPLSRPQPGKHRRFTSLVTPPRHPRIYPFSCRVNRGYLLATRAILC